MSKNEDWLVYSQTIDDPMVKFGYQRVGTSDKKDERCGQFMGHVGCLRVDLHNLITLDGKDHHDKAYVRRVYHSCNRPECRVCVKRWSIKQANAVDERFFHLVNGYSDKNGKHHDGLGLVEHLIDSCSKSEYDLPFEELKKRSLEAVKGRGFIGGFQIFHAERYHHADEAYVGEPAHWFFAPHFHFLGFLKESYSRCRSCKKRGLECLNCSGFEGLTRRLNKTDGHIVKIPTDKWGHRIARRSVFATVKYQLSHATIVRSSHGRAIVGWWVGACSYNRSKLGINYRVKKPVCKICGHDLIPIRYVGAGEANFGQWWIEEFEDGYLDERGVPKWIEKIENVRGHCYE